MWNNLIDKLKNVVIKPEVHYKALNLDFSLINLNVFNLLYKDGHKVLQADFTIEGKQISFFDFYGLNSKSNVSFNVNYLNSFAWLQHLKTTNTIISVECAIRYLESWCNENNNTNLVSQNFYVLSQRIFYWIICANFFTQSANQQAINKIVISLNTQCNFFLLNYKNYLNANSYNCIDIAKALLVIGICSNNYTYIAAALDITLAFLDNNILADGGHNSRNPTTTLAILQNLLYVFYLIKDNASLHKKSIKIRNYLDNITLFIKSIRLQNSGLFVFNGGVEEDKFTIDFLLSLSNVSANSILDLKHSGYINLLGTNSRLVFDTGAPLPDYNSLLTNEIALNNYKIITNNGPYKHVYNFDNNNANSRLDHSGIILKNTKGEVIFMPLKENDLYISKRTEDQWEIINFTYHGLKQKYGIIYHKHVFVSLLNQEYIHCEELLSCSGVSNKLSSATIRFNLSYLAKEIELHTPQLASFVVNGNKYCLKTPDSNITKSNCFYKAIQGQSIKTFCLDINFNLKSKTLKQEWMLYKHNQTVR